MWCGIFFFSVIVPSRLLVYLWMHVWTGILHITTLSIVDYSLEQCLQSCRHKKVFIKSTNLRAHEHLPAKWGTRVEGQTKKLGHKHMILYWQWLGKHTFFNQHDLCPLKGDSGKYFPNTTASPHSFFSPHKTSLCETAFLKYCATPSTLNLTCNLSHNNYGIIETDTNPQSTSNRSTHSTPPLVQVDGL